MGGAKKRSITQAEKAQAATGASPEKKDAKATGPQSRISSFRPISIDDKQAASSLKPLGAITLYSASAALGVKPSLAAAVLRSLESKGLVKRYGGFSGHYIYTWA